MFIQENVKIFYQNYILMRAFVKERFVMPEERNMNFGDFLDVIEDPEKDPGGIYYIQKQNSNLTEEFSELLQQVIIFSFFFEIFTC